MSKNVEKSRFLVTFWHLIKIINFHCFSSLHQHINFYDQHTRKSSKNVKKTRPKKVPKKNSVFLTFLKNEKKFFKTDRKLTEIRP